MKLITMAALLLCATPTYGHAQQQGDRVPFYGYVEVSCGTWTLERREKSVNSYIYRAWVQGIVSGFNLEATDHDIVRTDTGGIDAWVDQYCEKHPLETLAKAAIMLVRQPR